MQFLIFHLGPDRYGLATRRIERVLPLLDCKQLPGAPAYVAGLADYRGRSVPVIDLNMLALGTPAAACLDTRLVLVRYEPSHRKGELLGLVAERVTGVEQVDQQLFCEPGVALPERAGYLGKVAAQAGMLQLVEPEYLLSDDVRALLFPAREDPC